MKTRFFRKLTRLLFTPVVLTLMASVRPAVAEAAGNSGARSSDLDRPSATAEAAQPRVLVDPRIELVSLIFRLAGNPEYNQCRIPSYAADADRQFAGVRNHPVVQLARQLRRDSGVGYDACMSLAVLLTDASDPALKVPLKPWPESLDHRWTVDSASNFVKLAGQFVRDAKFGDFVKAHQELYATGGARTRELIGREAHLGWFSNFFGEARTPGFTVVASLFNGGQCYGPHSRDTAGRAEIFAVIGTWATDAAGQPVYRKDALPVVVHEFCHSYANPIIERHWSELRASGEAIYPMVANKMRSQAYGDAKTMYCESLVRASVVRYLRKNDGQAAAARQIEEEVGNGFAWMPDLSEMLDQYEGQRPQYPTLDSFAPTLAAFFNDYARNFAKKQAALEAKRPKVVSLTPANGATNVHPKLKTIQVVFDRPMRDQSWSMCGSGPNFPEPVGRPRYDAQRTTWTVSVNLQPDHEYEFWLNSGQYQAFQSDDGTPLESVPVKFRTAK